MPPVRCSTAISCSSRPDALALCQPPPRSWPRPDAPLPCRQPQLAADGQAVYLACAANNTIYFARSTDGGRSFAAADDGRVGAVACARHASRSPHRRVGRGAGRYGDCGDGWAKDRTGICWPGVRSMAAVTWTGPVISTTCRQPRAKGCTRWLRGATTVVTAWLDLREKGHAALLGDVRPTAAAPGRRTRSSTSRHPAPSASAAIPRWRSRPMARSWRCSATSWTATATSIWRGDERPVCDSGEDWRGHLACSTAARWMAAASRRPPAEHRHRVAAREDRVPGAPGQEEVKVGRRAQPGASRRRADGPVIAWNATDGPADRRAESRDVAARSGGKFVALAATEAGDYCCMGARRADADARVAVTRPRHARIIRASEQRADDHAVANRPDGIGLHQPQIVDDAEHRRDDRRGGAADSTASRPAGESSPRWTSAPAESSARTR